MKASIAAAAEQEATAKEDEVEAREALTAAKKLAIARGGAVIVRRRERERLERAMKAKVTAATKVLNEAVSKNDLAAARAALDDLWTDQNRPAESEQPSPLMVAAATDGCLRDMAMLLLDRGAEVNLRISRDPTAHAASTRVSTGATALVIASRGGSVGFVKLLLDRAADPNLGTTFSRTTPLSPQPPRDTSRSSSCCWTPAPLSTTLIVCTPSSRSCALRWAW